MTVWRAPATWLDAALQRGSRGALSLGDAQGRIWAGSGTLQALLPRGEPVTLGRLRWSVAAAELLRGRLRFNVLSMPEGAPLVDVSLGTAGLTIHSSHLQLPAALLGAVSPTLREAALGGQLLIEASEFQWTRQQAAGAVDIVWTDAATGRVRVNPLGSYRIECQGEQSGAGGLDCRIATISADAALKLTGSCRLASGQPIELDATAEAGESARRELVPLLRIIGKELRPGLYQLQPDPGIGLDFHQPQPK